MICRHASITAVFENFWIQLFNDETVVSKKRFAVSTFSLFRSRTEASELIG